MTVVLLYCQVDFVMEILSKLVSKQVWLSACSFSSVDYVYLVVSQAMMLIARSFEKRTDSIYIKLVQIWRMPKLWVGFLKCVSQTQPHSFHVLLQVYTFGSYMFHIPSFVFINITTAFLLIFGLYTYEYHELS